MRIKRGRKSDALPESKGTAYSKPTGLPWYWRNLSRFIGGACSVVLAFLILSPVPGFFWATYFRVNATYISQKISDRFVAPQLEVKVRYELSNHSKVTAYIHPQYRALPSGHKLIPVYYLSSNPRIAYYAGPGGDEKLATAVLYPIFGVSLGTIGIYLLYSAITWRRQVLALAYRPGQRGIVRLRWKQPAENVATAVITPRSDGLEYSWEVLAAKTPIDGIVAFLWPLLRVKNFPRPGSSVPLRPETAEVAGNLGPHQWLILNANGQLILPRSRAEPIIGTGQSLSISPGSPFLFTTHRQLLAAYAAVLTEARQLPAFIRPPAKSDGLPLLHTLRTLLCWRVLVRFHVEGHVRRQLKSLDDACIRAQMLTTTENFDDRERDKFTEMRAQLQLLSNSLTNVRSRLASLIVIVAAVLPVLLALVKVHQLQFNLLVQIVFYWLLRSLVFLPGIFALMAYNDAFRCKRRLFASFQFPKTSIGQSDSGIYALEDEMFAQIGQRKHLEPMSDCYARILVLTAWTTLWIWSFLTAKSSPYPLGANVVVIISVITTIWVWRSILTVRRRMRDVR